MTHTITRTPVPEVPPAGASERPAFLQSIIDGLHSSAQVETVFGASREEHGRTVLPVARVWYGFGGAQSTARKEGEHAAQVPNEGGGGGIMVNPVGVFEFEGGGGGIMVNPVGVFAFTEQGTRFVPVTGSKLFALAALLGGPLLGPLMRRAARSTR